MRASKHSLGEYEFKYVFKNGVRSIIYERVPPAGMKVKDKSGNPMTLAEILATGFLSCVNIECGVEKCFAPSELEVAE